MTVQRIHLANAAGRDATLLAVSTSPKPGHRPAKHGTPVSFQRYVAAGEALSDQDLNAQFGGAYDKQLIDGDPEIDFEIVGRRINTTQSVLIGSSGEPLYCAPEVVEIVIDPNGNETDRRAPNDAPANINDAVPVAWTGRMMTKADMVRRFAVRRTVQLRHVDGVTFDFNQAMAKELAEKKSVILIGAGEGGKGPLLFQLNGSPYRGFLEGRVEGERYQLLLHLSNMEL
ncbi:MAG: hypothetical protein WAO29_00560, partial [Candidatus Nanopelagicales bacterium]